MSPRRNPDIQVILGHAGFPVQRDAEYFDLWRTEMSAPGEAENVACKVSGFGMADNHWTIESIRPWVLHCIEAFGPGRIMFGTNWPVDVLYATYLEQTDAYRTDPRRGRFQPLGAGGHALPQRRTSVSDLGPTTTDP